MPTDGERFDERSNVDCVDDYSVARIPSAEGALTRDTVWEDVHKVFVCDRVLGQTTTPASNALQ